MHNPRTKEKVEKLNSVDEGGHLTQITLTDHTKSADTSTERGASQDLTVTQDLIGPHGEVVARTSEIEMVSPAASTQPVDVPKVRTPSVPPFRDPIWLQVELSYQRMAVENLNTLTRSYNLMCPQLAQRPYFDLQRELLSCYAEVAPLIAKEIQGKSGSATSSIL